MRRGKVEKRERLTKYVGNQWDDDWEAREINLET